MNIEKEYKAYLFDMDGTLVNSERLKGLALSETCKFYGGLAGVEVYKAVMGENWEKVRSHFFAEARINPDTESFDQEFKHIYQELLNKELEPNPNVVQCLAELKKQKKKLGLVSSAFSWMVEQVLDQVNLTGFFDVIVSKEQVTKHKPDPQAYFVALNKLGLRGAEVLVFEDSFAGLTAAHRANCDVVAFRHEFNANHDLSLALGVISDYSELVLYNQQVTLNDSKN